MTTKTNIKTTVTLTFSFNAEDERGAVARLLNNMRNYQDETPQVLRDCEDGGYTLISRNSTIANSFKFNDAGELASKYGSFLGTYELARALIDCGKCESVTAKSETIEVEED